MKKILKTKQAPEAIGPYSQGVDTGDLVFVSGQIPIDPATGKIEATDIENQTRQVFENIKAVLLAADLGLEHVVKMGVFLKTLDEFQAMNAVYAEYFPGDPPARSTIATAGLPMGARVEIDVIARR
ncbi:MAG: RidA family protein [bacterium]|nr:RidA family protein [bacterium]